MEKQKKRAKTVLVWVVFLLGFVFLFQMAKPSNPTHFAPFDEFRRDLDRGRVSKVELHNDRMNVELVDGDRYSTAARLDDELTSKLAEQDIPLSFGEQKGFWQIVLPYALAAAVVVGVLYFFLRRFRGGQNDIFALRKSKARLMPDESKVTFADVGGCDEAKLLLGDVIDFLHDPKRWAQAGARVPRGVLLEGPPGCGKTLLARAVAGETNARFYLTAASEFVEMFVGVGAARVRDTFDTARQNAPAVIFIDELDAVGRRRGSGIGSSHDEREQTLNQLLVCLDGFESRDAVVVMAATNRPDILDAALLRAGRFDRRIKVPPLSRDARLQTLCIHTRNKKLGADVSLDELADRTEGFQGAQLEAVANEAAVRAIRRARGAHLGPPEVRMSDFLDALQPANDQKRFFNKLDAVLIESTTQLAEPTGKALLRVVLDGTAAIEGELVWADANFLKIRCGRAETIVPKAQVRRIEALDGTEAADRLDVASDPWASRMPGTM